MQQKGIIGATKNFSLTPSTKCAWCGTGITVRKDRPTTNVCRLCKPYEKYSKRG
jgi:hypothetical protein